jgi:hypothetical protein
MRVAERQAPSRRASKKEAAPLLREAMTSSPEVTNGELIHDLVRDLVAKQQALSTLIDRLLAEEAQSPGTLSVQELGRLMALHSQNASRLGRLLRDKRALSGEVVDGMANAINQALDELSSEWGIEL